MWLIYTMRYNFKKEIDIYSDLGRASQVAQR